MSLLDRRVRFRRAAYIALTSLVMLSVLAILWPL